MARFRSWLRSTFRRRDVERDLADELAFHVQARSDYWRERGLSADEAVRRARIEFGAAERYKDECRQSLGLRVLDELTSDLRYALRRLRATPAFTAIAIAILAVALGANTAVFSVLETVMLKALPVERPQDLRELAWVQPANSTWQMSYDGSKRGYPGGNLIATSFSHPIYEHLRDHATVFADLFLFTQSDVTVTAAGRDQRASGLLVSGTFLSGLGVRPAMGRTLGPDDDRTGAPAVAVISHACWLRLFAASPNVVGQPVVVNGTPAAIVGVTPAAFYGVEPGVVVDVFLPIAPFLASVDNRGDRRANPHFWAFRMMGRVVPGVADASVAVETEALMRQALPPDYARDPAGLTRVVVNPGGQGLDSLRRNYAQPLYLLFAIMASVLLIACGNLAGLLVTRTTARAREMTMRLALGASRRRLVRQLLTESVLLASMGGAVGVYLAWLIRGSVLPLLNQEDAPLTLALGVDAWLIAFIVAICLIVGLLCGLLPALRATGVRAAGPSSTRIVSSAPGRSSRLSAGKSLIAIQVTLSMVLLASAGLFVRTLHNLRSEALGFKPDHVLLFEIDATASGYADARLNDFYERALDRLSVMAGVRAVSMARYGLLSGGATTDAVAPPGAAPDAKRIGVHLHHVSPRHFETMDIPMRAGRDFTAQDREGAPKVAIINESLARSFATAGVPVGQHVRYDDADVEIVGIVGDARFASLREPAPPTLYLPYRQSQQHRMTFALRTTGDPTAAAEPARQVIESIDPRVPVYEVRTQEAQIDDAVRQERVFAYAGSGFALLAVTLACLGIYGTLAYSVTRRTAEIGLRMALGASRGEIAAMVLRESLTPTIVGVFLGLAAAATATRYLESMLFGLTARDPATLAGATAALLASALMAAWIPSHRASSVDPITALRTE